MVENYNLLNISYKLNLYELPNNKLLDEKNKLSCFRINSYI